MPDVERIKIRKTMQCPLDVRHEQRGRLGHDVVTDAGQHHQLRAGDPVREHEPGAQRRHHVIGAPHDQGRRATLESLVTALPDLPA